MPPSKKISKIPDSFFGRASKLVSTGATLLGQEIALRASKSLGKDTPEKSLLARIRQTEGLVQSLSQLKGAAMKAGQLLSIEGSDLLPPEVLAVLRQLYEDSASLPYAEVTKILRRELGPEKYQQIKNLSHEPIAAASIGQVHKAQIDGRTVAIKLQFPGVAASIDSDLAIVKRLVQGLLIASQRKIDVDQLFVQLSENLKHEVDYELEARSAQEYKRGFAGRENYVVPEIFPEYSTGRVLTATFEEGLRINDWVASRPSPEEAASFAALILELIVIEFFELGLVQTDPNFGNFLYRPAEKRLVLLDFGATYRYPLGFRQDYLDLGKLSMVGSDGPILEKMFSMGIFDRRESSEAKDRLLVMMESIISIFLPENQPFCFGHRDFIQKMREDVLSLIGAVQHTPPQRDLIFLNRKLGGMFHLLKDLDAAVDLTPYWQRIQSMVLHENSGRH